MNKIPKDMDFTTNQEFYDYYAEKSITTESFQKFRNIRDKILKIRKQSNNEKEILEIGDIGCGAGTQCIVWSEIGHKVHGLDINRALLELAIERSQKYGYEVDYQLGTATKLPWSNESLDVCIMLELLEHVPDWKACLNECNRVLAKGGVLFMSTTNWICPVQNEFKLPLYSWYPTSFKRQFERIAVSSRPALVNYAKYPAVNWFSFYSLKRELEAKNFECCDRFDLMNISENHPMLELMLNFMRKNSFLRLLGHLMSSGTIIAAVKKTP